MITRSKALDGFCLTGRNSRTSNGARYEPVGGASGDGDATFTNASIVIPYNCTLVRVQVRVTANTKDGATTFTVRQNGADVSNAALPLSVPANTVGFYDSGTISIPFTAGDTYAPKSDTSASTNANTATYIITCWFQRTS